MTFSCESGGGKPVPTDEQNTEARISDSINENLHIDPTPDTYRIRHLYDKQYAYRYRHYGFTSEYQYNDMSLIWAILMFISKKVTNVSDNSLFLLP